MKLISQNFFGLGDFLLYLNFYHYGSLRSVGGWFQLTTEPFISNALTSEVLI